MFEKITEYTFDEIYPLLEAAFPVTELREKEEQRNLLRMQQYELYGVRCNEGFMAVFALWQMEDFLYIEHFAVRQEERGKGLGGKLLDLFLAEQKKPVLLEVEVPVEHDAKRRVAFYERHGFIYHAYPYFQPPMRKGQEPLPLRFMTAPKAMDEKTYKRYRETLYRIVYQYKG